MARSRHVLWACLALLANRALADCTCSGLDYTNGGSYLIDGSSDREFVFTSQFSGKLSRDRKPSRPKLTPE